jgi:hypothetical protein
MKVFSDDLFLRGDFLQTRVIFVKNAQNLVTRLLLLRAKTREPIPGLRRTASERYFKNVLAGKNRTAKRKHLRQKSLSEKFSTIILYPILNSGSKFYAKSVIFCEMRQVKTYAMPMAF